MKSKKIVIGLTGSTGVIGKHFQKKYSKYNFDNFIGDIQNYKDVQKWVKKTKASAIIHLAAKVPTDYVCGIGSASTIDPAEKALIDAAKTCTWLIDLSDIATYHV